MSLRIFRYLMVIGVLPVMLVVASCVEESFEPDGRDGLNRITFVVSIPSPTVPVTRAITEGSGEDNRVDEITILFFNATAPHNYVGYFSVDNTNIENTGSAYATGGYAHKKFTVTMPPDSRKALFLANAAGRIAQMYNLSEGKAVGDGSALTGKTLSDMQGELNDTFVAGQKYNADPEDDGYEPFVMVSAIKTVDPAVRVDYTDDPVELVRNVAKINVTVDATVTNFTMHEIVLCDYAVGTSLCPADNWWGENTATALNTRLFASSGVTRPASPTLAAGVANGISYSGSVIKDGKACVDEIFTFERPVATGAVKNLSLLVRGDVTVGEVTHEDCWYKLELLKIDPSDGRLKNVNVLRNYSYTLNITAVAGAGHHTKESAYAAPAVGLTVQMEAAYGEQGMNDGVYNGQYQLVVDRSTITIGPAASTELLKVYTDFAGGWSSEGATDWLTLSTEGAPEGNITSSTPVTLTVQPNTGNIRRVNLRITAGALVKSVTVIQLPDPEQATNNMPDNVDGYVGASWTSQQTSERLIRVLRPTTGETDIIDGEWKAYVLEGKGWISLDTAMTADPHVWTDNPDYDGSDESGEDRDMGVYEVSGTKTEIGGILNEDHPYIYFRIGLRSELSDGALPRYGTVLLVCWSGTGESFTQRIRIRQGQAGGEPEEGNHADGTFDRKGITGNANFDSSIKPWTPNGKPGLEEH